MLILPIMGMQRLPREVGLDPQNTKAQSVSHNLRAEKIKGCALLGDAN
jgi:hypothetical protein